MRISAAVALIRTKPQEMEGKQYAEHLQDAIKANQKHWRQEYDKIKDELLELKQSQVLHNLSGTYNLIYS